MAVEEPGVSAKAGDPKTVSLADFLNFKRASLDREKKLKLQLAEIQEERDSFKAESEAIGQDAEGEEKDRIQAVRDYLTREKKKLDAERRKHQDELKGFTEREKAVRVKELVAEYKQRGVEADIEELLTEDNPETLLQNRYIEFLEGKLKGGTPETPETPEVITKTPRILERTVVGVVKKMPKDMDEKEFATYHQQIKQEALSKR